METLIATGNSKLNGALYVLFDGSVSSRIKNSQELIDTCVETNPELVIVSSQLPISDNLSWQNILPYLKQLCPETRFVFIDTTLDKNDLLDKTFIQTLIAYGIYDIYTYDKITLKRLTKLINNPRDRYDNDKWLKQGEEVKISSLSTTSDNEPTNVIQLPLKQNFTYFISQSQNILSSKAGKFTVKRELIGAFLVLTGAFLLYKGYAPVYKMKQNVQQTESAWEETKKDAIVEDVFVGMTKIPEDDALIGMIKITPSSSPIGIRYGVTEENLDAGAGLDKNSSLINISEGNSVIHGHREEVFWDLKNIQIGDTVSIELPNGTFAYEVYETLVVSPEDKSYYNNYSGPEISLVTCYPFVYMGKVTDRYVVKAKLID